MPVELDPDLLIDYSLNFVSIGVIIFLGVVSYYLIRRGISSLHDRDYISRSAEGILLIILRWTIVILIVLLGLQQVGVEITAIWAGLSAMLVFVGVGLVAVWSVFSNVLCSLLLLLFRPFRIGDEIEITEATGGTGLKGRVVNLNLLFTFLEEEPEESDNVRRAIVQIPNNIFFQKTIRRWQGIDTESLDRHMFKKQTPDIVR
jgi:small-conductance mechanosensitive channel